MTHAEIEERQIVDRYALGKLSEADAEEFEEHYLGCRQCLGELELAERIQAAARTVAAEDASRSVAAQGLALFAWLARRGRFVQLAVVAVLVLLPAAALMRQVATPAPGERSPVLDPPATLAPQAGTPVIVLRPVRGGPEAEAPSLLLDLPVEPRWLVLSVELAPPLEAAYRVVLLRVDPEEEIWRIESLMPDFAGLLNVSFHTSFFEDGDYLLEVEALTPKGGSVPVGRHPFQVAGAASDGPS